MSSTAYGGGEFLGLDDPTGAVIFCGFQGVQSARTCYASQPVLFTSSIYGVIPCQHPGHGSQPLGFPPLASTAILPSIRQKLNPNDSKGLTSATVKTLSLWVSLDPNSGVGVHPGGRNSQSRKPFEDDAVLHTQRWTVTA
jgi:hypothetical protein